MSARQATVRRSAELEVPARVAFERICRVEEYPHCRPGVIRVVARSETEHRWELADAVFTARIREREPDHLLRWQAVTGPVCEETVSIRALNPLRSRVTVTAVGPGELMDRIALDVTAFKRLVELEHPGSGHYANERPAASFRHRSNWRDGLMYGRTAAGDQH